MTHNAILASLGIRFAADEGMGYGNEGTVHHAGGTMRMSGNGSGVVDTNLKFEAYDNLYGADPSVGPTSQPRIRPSRWLPCRSDWPTICRRGSDDATSHAATRAPKKRFRLVIRYLAGARWACVLGGS